MAQERYYNYGGTASDAAENLINASLHTKGVYLGMDLSVNSDSNLAVAAGTILLPDGILCRETTGFSIVFSPPGTPTDYTLVASHDNRSILGGVPVEYELRDSIYTDADLITGIVLGWIFHPGGGVPLISDYVLSAAKQFPSVSTAAAIDVIKTELIPPLPRSIITNVGINITVVEAAFDGSNFLVYEQIENSPTAVPAIQTALQNITMYYNGYRPREIALYTYFPLTPATKIDVEVYDTAQVPVPVTDGTIYGTGTWAYHTVTVDRATGTFDADKPYTVRLTFTVNQGEYIRLGRIQIDTSPYPTT